MRFLLLALCALALVADPSWAGSKRRLNTRPIVEVSAPATFAKNVPTPIYCTANDPEGDPVNFTWSATCTGTSFADPNAPLTDVTVTDAPQLSCNLICEADDGHPTPFTRAVQVQILDVPPDNESPVVTANPTQHSRTGGGTINLSCSATDDGNPAAPGFVTILWSAYDPGDVLLDGSEIVPTNGQNVVVTARNASGTATVFCEGFDGELRTTVAIPITVSEDTGPPVSVSQPTGLVITHPTTTGTIGTTCSGGDGVDYYWKVEETTPGAADCGNFNLTASPTLGCNPAVAAAYSWDNVPSVTETCTGVSITCCDDNSSSCTTRPVVVAGANQVVDQGDPVTLTADNHDSWSWTQTQGIPVVLSSPTAQNPTFTAPTVSQNEILVFRVTAVDSGISSCIGDTTQVTVQKTGATLTNRALAGDTTATASSFCAGLPTCAVAQPPDAARDNVVNGWPDDATKEWSSQSEGAGAWLRFTWPSNRTVSRIVLFDRKNTTDHCTGGTLTFSSGAPVAVGSLENDASTGTTINFSTPPTRSLTWVQFTCDTVSGTTANVGLAEMEVWGP